MQIGDFCEGQAVITVGDPFEITIPARHGFDRELSDMNSNNLLVVQSNQFNISSPNPE